MKIQGSSKSTGRLHCEPQMHKQNFMAVQPATSEIFQSGPKQLTSRFYHCRLQSFTFTTAAPIMINLLTINPFVVVSNRQYSQVSNVGDGRQVSRHTSWGWVGGKASGAHGEACY